MSIFSLRSSQTAPAARASARRDSSAVVPGPEGPAAPIQSLRPSKESFLARVMRWLGGDGSSTSQDDAHPEALRKLRPPATGRVSFFFGRLSGLTPEQIKLARSENEALRRPASIAGRADAAPATEVCALAPELLDCLKTGARHKPNQLFDAVCGLWSTSDPAARALQGKVEDFLLSGVSPDDRLQAIRTALDTAQPGQRRAQLEARAQAVYAALVGSARHYAGTHPAVVPAQGPAAVVLEPIAFIQEPAVLAPRPLNVLVQELATLESGERSAETFLARVHQLAGISKLLEALRADEPDADNLDGLQVRCQALRASMHAEGLEHLKTEDDAFSALSLQGAYGKVDAVKARVKGLSEACAIVRTLPDSRQHDADNRASNALLASLQENFNAVARSAALIESYAPIKTLGSRGEPLSLDEVLVNRLRDGTVKAYRVAEGPIKAICDWEASELSAKTLRVRVGDLASIKTSLAALASSALDEKIVSGLHARWQGLCTASQSKLDDCLEAEETAFSASKLPDAQGKLKDVQETLDGLREVGLILRGLPDSHLEPSVLKASDALAASLQDNLDAVARSAGVLERYAAIKDLALSGADRSPCEKLVSYLRQHTVAEYRAVQDPIDAICALADPGDHVDLLAALGTGVLGKGGEVRPNLAGQVHEANLAAVNGILVDAQWDSLVGALKLAAIDRKELAALTGAATPEARAGITEKFAKERFATRILHQRRVLNNEINRLIAEKKPSLKFDLVGLAGAAPGASEATIKEIRKVGGGLSRQLDVLLVNWIYCSCLDPATMDINSQRVQVLCAVLRGGRAQVPGLDEAQKLLEKGFLNFAAVKDVNRRINGFAQVLADAKMLAKASHDHDPRVRAQGLVMELQDRLVGPAVGAAASVPPAQRIKDRVEAARKEWVAASGPKAARLLTEIHRRDALRAGLEGRQWKFEATSEDLVSAPIPKTHFTRADQLKVLSQCLEVVVMINEQKALRTPQSVRLAADLEKNELRPLAAQLTHFDVATRSFRGAAGAAPQLGELQRLVDQRGDLAQLLNVSENVARLTHEISKPSPPSDALAQVVEATVRVAVLEEAVANNSTNFQVAVEDSTTLPVDRIRARLADYGLESSDPIPTIARMVGAVPHQVTREELDMAALCKRLDPIDPGAAGVLQRDVPGSIRYASDFRGLVARGRAMLGAPQARQRLDNLHAVEQRFASLEPGGSFGIQVGHRGEVEIDAPLPPGVSGGATASFEYSRGIRISRQDGDRYEVDIVGTISAGLAGTASALGGAVEASAGVGAEAGKGFRISCESREQAVELVESLVGVRQLDEAGWSGGRVQELRVSQAQVRAQLNAKFEMDTPLDTPLFKIEAELAAAAKTQLEVTGSFLQRTERRTEERAWRAGVAVNILDGAVTGDAERGATVRVTRTCRRGGVRLLEPPELSVRVHVLGNDPEANLQRAIPQLQGEELAHYAEQVRQAQKAAEESGQTVDVELECGMTPQSVIRANQQIRLAHDRLRAPGQDPAQAKKGVKKALLAADLEMREPANYVIRGIHVIQHSASEAVEETRRPVKATARVAGEQRQALQPWSGSGCVGAALPENDDRYRSLLGASSTR